MVPKVNKTGATQQTKLNKEISLRENMPRDCLITGSTDADCRILPRWYVSNVSNPFDGGSAGWSLHQPVERLSHLEGLEVRMKLPRCLDSWWEGCVCVNDPYLEDTSISPLLMVGVLARILLFFAGNCWRSFTVITHFFRKLCSGVKDHNSHGTCEAAMRGTHKKTGTDGGLLLDWLFFSSGLTTAMMACCRPATAGTGSGLQPRQTPGSSFSSQYSTGSLWGLGPGCTGRPECLNQVLVLLAVWPGATSWNQCFHVASRQKREVP